MTENPISALEAMGRALAEARARLDRAVTAQDAANAEVKAAHEAVDLAEDRLSVAVDRWVEALTTLPSEEGDKPPG